MKTIRPLVKEIAWYYNTEPKPGERIAVIQMTNIFRPSTLWVYYDKTQMFEDAQRFNLTHLRMGLIEMLHTDVPILSGHFDAKIEDESEFSRDSGPLNRPLPTSTPEMRTLHPGQLVTIEWVRGDIRKIVLIGRTVVSQ